MGRLNGNSAIARRLNRIAPIVFICGLFMTLSVLCFWTMCSMPCEDYTDALNHETRSMVRNKAFRNNFLSLHPDLEVKLVILIITGPNNINERDTIRQTWLNGVGSDVLYRFVVGVKSLDIDAREKVIREDTFHKDLLILSSVNDSYQCLTHKVLEAFIWLDKTVDFQHVLKVDDDTFVRVSSVLLELSNKPKDRLYWGFFDGRANVKLSGKWQETEWNLCDKYLPYARGGGYVLSSDLVHFIASNHRLLHQYLNEDVSVGAWLAPLRINRHHDQNFDTEYASRGCLNSFLITHKQPVLKMRELYNNLKSRGQLCQKETLLRASYEYDWSYPPSRCCIRPNLKSESKRNLAVNAR